MELRDSKILITGGAGLIGSALATRLATDNEVIVVDDLSNGIEEVLPDTTTFLEGDLTDKAVVAEAITEDIDLVCHLAADKYVDADQP